MNGDISISNLLDEIVSGQAYGKHLHENLDLILRWLANPNSDSVAHFRREYTKRDISNEKLRRDVFYLLQQKLFSKNDSQPHEVLGLSVQVKKDQAKARYRKLMRVYHPDKAAGNIDNFNSIAEKINLAYRQFIKGRDNFEHVKIDSTSVARTVYQAENVRKDKIESQFVRNIRHSIGSVKQFQVLFFGAVASLCLFVIVLLYLQSGGQENLHSYSDRAKANTLEQQELINHEPVESQSQQNKSEAALIEAVSNPAGLIESSLVENVMEKQANEVDIATGAESGNSIQNGLKTGQSSLSTVDSTDLTALPQLIVLPPFRRLPNDYEAAVSDKISVYGKTQKPLITTDYYNNYYDSRDDKPEQPGMTASVSVQPLVELLSEGIETEPIVVESTDDVTLRERGDPHSPESSQSRDTRIQSSTQQTRLTGNDQQKNRIETVTGFDSSNVQSYDTETYSEHAAAGLNITEDVSDFTQTHTNQPPSAKLNSQEVIAPVKEVKVSTLPNNAVEHFPVANIFEKRFARKFLVQYLESIENGNVKQINDFLSNNLIIDGVANNKANYLKNTSELIDQTSKRQFHVHFIGDVLRLEQGVFRVTVTLSRTYFFKNNIVSKNTAKKKFDIKRYSNGSEIINISSV